MKSKTKPKQDGLNASEIARLTADIAAENLKKGAPAEGPEFAEGPDDAGNPLLSSLPKTLDAKEVFAQLASLPAFDVEERKADASFRMTKVMSLERIHIPTPTSIRIYQAIDRFIRATYRRSDPRKAINVQALFALNNGVVRAKDMLAETDGGSCIVVPGITGGGKTNLIRAIQKIYPVCVLHGAKSGMEQRVSIPMLYVRSSGEPSYVALGRDFGASLQVYVGDNALSAVLLKRSRLSLDDTSRIVEQACKTYCIGLVIFDEFQDVVGTNNDNATRMTRMLMNQRDNSGVPILYAGNYGMIPAMQTNARFTRRHAIGGFSLDRLSPDSPYWQRIVKTFWKCQWVQSPIPLTAELSSRIYEFSQGVPGYLKLLMQGAHEVGIGGRETIDAEVLEASYAHTMSANHKYIQALASGDIEQIRQYPDIYNPLEGRDAGAELRAVIAERRRKQAKRDEREAGVREEGYRKQKKVAHG